MTERQRRLLLLVEACNKADKPASAHRLSMMSAFAEVTVLEDLHEMAGLGMIRMDRVIRNTSTGRCAEFQAALTAKGEALMSRVRELV